MIPLKDVLAIAKEDEGYREDYLTCLYEQVAKLPNKSIVVEIGCYKGMSTLAMAGAIEGTDSHIFTIDPIFITGEITYPDSLNGQWTLQSSVNKVRSLWARVGVNYYITVMADYSWNVLQRWDKGLLDYILVDGEHTYNAVIRDCEWIGLLKKNRRAFFDDWIAEVSQAVEEYASIHPECQLVQYGKPPEHLCLSYIQK